ncbi:hypothetical protein ELK94_27875, partial [Klebsiella pneumoniae]|nr:hypothetical protein [Klebsiella pneumoniae]
SAQIREILINESAWEEMTCLFALSLNKGRRIIYSIKQSSSSRLSEDCRRLSTPTNRSVLASSKA